MTADNDKTAMVAVLGTQWLKDPWWKICSEGSTSANSVGQTIRINRQNYAVIGVLKSKGSHGPNNQDDVIMMPLHTAQLKLGGAVRRRSGPSICRSALTRWTWRRRR